MRIIITRHGETEENRAGIIQGHLPGVLSDLGKEQARRLANRLKDEDIDLIVSSDLARALDTAKAVGKFHDDIDLTLDERLRERCFKEFEGKSKKDLGIPEGVKFVDYFGDKDIESNDEIFSRVKKLIKEVSAGDNKSILLVGHMGVCKFIISSLLDRSMEDLKELKLKNTSVSIFDIEGNRVETELLNCVRHLDED
ncbi:histidine phosphatase family protein [archaeon]|jgi:broad specificity phosphatase PhoE|nr:histidine phosphatase family protein [archaeon]MBT7128746.1 histidine phosphatase family protein [archaeon]